MKLQTLAAALLVLAIPARAEIVKVPLGAPPVIPATATGAPDAADEIRLNPSITVAGDVVRLGDVFSGYLVRPEKVVADAPAPGQRSTLSADWLANLSRTYGLGWRPASVYDRAVVYRPGETIAPADILSAVRAALAAKGLPANFELQTTHMLNAVTVAAGTGAEVGVREAIYDPTAKAFSAVVEIPANDPKALFVPLRGVAFATVAVPVLKENASKNHTITADMVDIINVREELVKPTTITDPSVLVGKTPKFFVKAGLPVQENEVAQMRLVEVPVMAVETSRDAKISEAQVVMARFNAADLPADAVLDARQLVGKTPRRTLPAGAPVRRGDVQVLRYLKVPVIAHDVDRGDLLTAADLTTVTLTDDEVASNVLTDASDVIGRAAKHAMRAGQVMRAFDIARPIAVQRGKMVTILYSIPMINLTAQGIAQEQGGVGDAIRVTNSKSNKTLIAEVIDAHTVRIDPRQAGFMPASAN